VTLTDTAIAYRVTDAAKISGISRTRLYELLAAGEIRALKERTGTLIPRAELERYLSTLPHWGGDDAR
jgi:excisionase family DNA binding protein